MTRLGRFQVTFIHYRVNGSLSGTCYTAERTVYESPRYGFQGAGGIYYRNASGEFYNPCCGKARGPKKLHRTVTPEEIANRWPDVLRIVAAYSAAADLVGGKMEEEAWVTVH